MADACAAAGLDVPVLDDATRQAIDVHLPSYGTSQNPVDSTAQGVHKLGYAEFARLVGQSPLIDGVIVVVTARRSAFLETDLPKLQALARESKKPVFMWTYTLPSARSIEILNEAGYPLFTGAPGCARTMRTLADYREARERQLSSSRGRHCRAEHARARARQAHRFRFGVVRVAGAACCSPLTASGAETGTLAHSADEAEAMAQRARTAGGAEGSIARYSAQDRSRRGGAQCAKRGRARCLRARPRRREEIFAARAHRRRAGAADGGARARGHPRHQPRCHLGSVADGGPGRRAGRGAR